MPFSFSGFGFTYWHLPSKTFDCFARVAIDLLCFLYSYLSLETLSEVSIFPVLLISLLDCSGLATGRVYGLPRLGVI